MGGHSPGLAGYDQRMHTHANIHALVIIGSLVFRGARRKLRMFVLYLKKINSLNSAKRANQRSKESRFLDTINPNP